MPNTLILRIQEVNSVSEKERKIGKKLAETFDALPDNGKEFLLGFMEGVAATKEQDKPEDERSADQAS